MAEQNEGATVVGTVKGGNGRPTESEPGKATVGKPRKFATSTAMRSKMAFGGSGLGLSGILEGSGGNFYSPELSTDFLELPQSLHEAWNYYRFFYRTEPFVGQAIDLHTELPLSKIRISEPKALNQDLARTATRFCTKWAKRTGLLRRLISIVHELTLIGEVFIWSEDDNPEMPDDVRFEIIRELSVEGEAVETKIERENADERAVAWLKKNYRGWTAVSCLPPEQVRMESFNFTDEKIFELIPDSKTKDVINRARQGDREAQRVVKSMPTAVVESVAAGNNIPLNTDPEAGSFVYHMANKRSDYEPRGHSILERCLLPGIPVTILRDNHIIRVPVEDVDVSTDLLLTHRGRFRKAQVGSRPVSENITVLHVEGLDPIALTSDHPVLVVAAYGSESWVHAGDLKPGDTVRESHPVPEDGYPEVIDLVRWWEDKTLTADRRVRPNDKGIESPTREVKVVGVDADDEGYVVTFAHKQDDAGRLSTVETDRRLTAWLKGLSEPTTASYAAVATVTGLNKMDVFNAVRRFERDVPRFKRHTEGRQSVWYPLPVDAQVPGEVMFRSETSSIRQIPVTEDFAYLLGTWFGDGSVWTADDRFLNTACIEWSIDEKDDETRNRILDLCHEFFGPHNVEVGNLIPSDSATCNVRVEDALLARWFHDEFGHSAQTKRVPKWVFDLPDGHVLAFLRGVLDTDGHLHTRKDVVISVEVTLDNEALVHQIHFLCNRVGIKTQVKPAHRKARSWTRRWKTVKGLKEKTYEYEPKTFWRLTASRHDEVARWAEGSVKGGRVEWPERNHLWGSNFKDGWLTRKVSHVESVAYRGPVYSFDVDEDESLTAGGVVVHNCIRTLVFRDKLRQANTSIASRHMTPIRIVWVEDGDAADVENLREQVDVALQDPDYSIIANFEVRWEEMGSDQRLLDLTAEYDLTDRQLYAGLGVTEGLLSGESAYSGDRINLEVINTRYMLRRELIQEFVEEQMFRPMCARMGFIEEDEDGEEVVVTPHLSFTRLALRDNNDTFDALYGLYQKGSLDIDVILELLNIDPVTTREKLKGDIFKVTDAAFNEVLRGIYGEAGRKIAENSDVAQKISEYLGLKYEEPKEEGGGRFG
jgi:intein/homing endonuclease